MISQETIWQNATLLSLGLTPSPPPPGFFFHLTTMDPDLKKMLEDPETEFLDINLTKDSSLLLHAFHSPFYWRVLKKTILYSGFNNSFKKNRETRKLEVFS